MASLLSPSKETRRTASRRRKLESKSSRAGHSGNYSSLSEDIELGFSVRAAFFMPRRNSFDTDKVTTTNWSSQAPSEPTIPSSRSPSPLFETGDWKPEMGKHYQGTNGQTANGHNSYKHLSEQDQAKKLFEIFQNLPDSTQTRILNVRVKFFLFLINDVF